MTAHTRRRRVAACLLASLFALASSAESGAQTPESEIVPVYLSVGRSYPVQTPVPVTRVSVANPEVADVAVIGERDVVINARSGGETDVLIWSVDDERRHYRVSVQSAAARMQIVLGVKIAEVRRDLLHEIGVSGLYRPDNVRVGTEVFRTDEVFTDQGDIQLPSSARFLTVLSDFGTDDFLAFLDLQSQRGNARLLAEPNLMTANNEEASFLAGGELPIPVVQNIGQGTGTNVTIQYREFGVRLNFTPELIGDSLVKLRVRPEVSSLDFANAILLQGFRIPALRTRRIESTVDVRRNESLIISGLFNEERERVRTGIPFLMDIPILGTLFSSTRWQNNESELIVIVTPMVIDPLRPRNQDTIRLRPQPRVPAEEALEPRLPSPPASRRP